MSLIIHAKLLDIHRTVFSVISLDLSIGRNVLSAKTGVITFGYFQHTLYKQFQNTKGSKIHHADWRK